MATQELRRRIKELTILRSPTKTVVYDRATLTLRPIAQDLADTFTALIENVELLGPESKAWDVVAEVLALHAASDLVNPLAGASPPPPRRGGDLIRDRIDPGRYLNKLAINMANDCNMACSYCYANQGLYGNPERALLTEADGEMIVRRFAERFQYIESVQFMGGEPSMNPGGLEAVGRTFAELVAKGDLPAMPDFSLVSNGLRFTPKFLDVAKTYDIQVTVSLDGPECAHDRIRIKANGKGTYAAVRRTIDTALARGLRLEFEPTFSRAHVDSGVHLIDLCQWFYDEFGVRVLHAPPMSENRYQKDGLALSEAQKVREYSAVTEWGVDNLLERHSYLLHGFTARLVESFETRVANQHICPAGNSLFAVSTRGDVSPCWMYTDEPEFSLGKVDSGDLLGAASREVLENMARYELHSHPECRACFMQPVCFGCKGGDYHTTGTMSERTGCEWMRAMVATFIMRLFSRPTVPTCTAEYMEKPLFGELARESLRPKGDFRKVSQPLVQLRRSPPRERPANAL